MASKAQAKYLMDLMYDRGYQSRGYLTDAGDKSLPHVTDELRRNVHGVDTWVRRTLTSAQTSELIDLCKRN